MGKYAVKTLNAISPVIHEVFDAQYEVSSDSAAPDAVLVRSASMHEAALNDELCAIARAGAGVNNIPIDKCSEAGVVVFNTPGANANAVAELVVAAMLLTCRDIVGGANWVQGLKGQGAEVGKLVEKGKAQFVGPEVRGKTLGVIGLGAIGALVANAAVGLGMEVIGCDPFITVEHAWALSRSVHRETSRADLIRQSDFITVHVPLLPDTKGMFDAAAFAAMKPGATLLNFSRGELVDTPSVLEALTDGKLRAYATDFPDDALLGVKGVLAIPHLGASTPESEDNCAQMAASQLRAFLETGEIRNSVNLPDVQLPRIESPDAKRVTILHKNQPGLLNAITGVLSQSGTNIAHLTNKSKGDLAYTVVDVDAGYSRDALGKLCALDEVLRVRIL